MASFRIGYYLSKDFDDIKATIAPFLSKIDDIDKGRWSLDGCLDDIKNGDLIAWMVWSEDKVIAVITTRICQARIKYLVIEDVAGTRLNEWIAQAHDEIEQLAKQLGCSQITSGGRAGWEKYFKQFGFTKSRVEGYKNIEVSA